MSEKIETTAEFGEMGELDLTVFYGYVESEPMTREEPGCDEGIEDVTVIANINNNKIDITDLIEESELMKTIVSECLADYHSSAVDAYEAHCDNLYQLAKDERI